MHSGVCDNMATLKFELNKKEFMVIDEMRKLFPELRARTMGHIGRKSKRILKSRFLSGQEIDLTVKRVGKKKWPAIFYSVGKNAKHVSISSTTMNLFEKGRFLRDGTKEAGKKVITGKLKQAVMSELQGMVNEFDSKVWEKEFNSV